jgi:hypothetical protein
VPPPPAQGDSDKRRSLVLLMPRKYHCRLAAGVVVMAVAAACAWSWLKAEYWPSQPVHIAQAFVTDLAAGRFAQAHELTTKNQYTGRQVAELADIASHNLCQVQVEKILQVFPFQSNGNRLRRWFTGRALEMPEVIVEFAGSCPFNVTVRRLQSQGWKVSSFQGHAG